MVCEWGMSELGPLAFGRKEHEVFLGRDFNQHQEYSDKTAVEIDQEVKNIIGRNYDRSRKILEEKSEALHRLAQALLEFESLDGDQIDRVIRGEKLEPVIKKTNTPPTAPATGADPKIVFNPIPEPGKA